MSFFHQQFELEKDGKNLVVLIWRQDDVITLKIGRKQTEKRWPSRKAAVAEVERLVAEYRAAGYREMLDERGIKKKPELPRNPALEKSILAAPKDVDGYSVYADWLSEQGDPYGEFVACHCQLASDPKNKNLQKREDDLWNKHGQAWMLDLWGTEKPLKKGAKPAFEIQNAFCGFLLGATLHTDAERLYPTLRKLRITFPVRELGIYFRNIFGLDNIGTVIAKHGLPPGLEFLGLIGDRSTTLGSLDIEKLIPAFVGLRDLTIGGHRIRLGKTISLPKLKSLTLASTRMKAEDLKALATAKLPKLEALNLMVGFHQHEPEVRVTDIESMLGSKAFAKLKSVAVSGPPGWHEAELAALSRGV